MIFGVGWRSANVVVAERDLTLVGVHEAVTAGTSLLGRVAASVRGTSEEAATVTTAVSWVTTSVTGCVTGDVISADSSVVSMDGVPVKGPARAAEGKSAAAVSVTAGTSETLEGMNALSGIAFLFSGKIPHARKPFIAVAGVAARPHASRSSDPN